MIAGIIAGFVVAGICVLAFALCRAASEQDYWEDDDYDG